MIESVYKPRRKKNGKTVVSRMYRGRYRLDGDYAITEVALGTPDKQVATKRLREIVVEAQKEKEGLIAPKAIREAANKALHDHLKEFTEDLKAIGREETYRKRLDFRIKRLIKECGWKKFRDITPDSFCGWRVQNGGIAPKTLNDYLDASRNFMNWLVRQGRIERNPLALVQKVDTRGKKRVRRALNHSEAERLLRVSGPRKALYLTAIFTGLRLNELKSLKWEDLEMDESKPFFRVRAVNTKNRKDAVIPMHRRVYEELLKESRQKRNLQFVFQVSSNPDRTIQMDYRNAGIDRVDSLGRKVDFHSLRNTFATMLAKEGIPQRIAQELMRHSDANLTANVYTDALQLPTFEAIHLLKGIGDDPQIAPQNLGARGPGVSCSGIGNLEESTPQVFGDSWVKRDLAPFDAK